MRNLITRAVRSARPRSGDRGAIGVLVAIFMSSGVLLGMGALVVDVGEIYTERSELQNGASAAALAVAKSCVIGICMPGIATSYAIADARNASGKITVGLVCGSGVLGPCPASFAGSACPQPPAAAGFVDVYASTPATGASALLPSVFATMLPGVRQSANSDITVCVQASWGAPAAAQATAVTISACSWQSATSNGTSFGPNPAYAPPAAASDVAFQLLTFSSGTGCASSRPVFGWASDLTGTCSLPVSGLLFPAWTGSLLPSCQQELAAAQADRIPVVIPIFTRLRNLAGVKTYQLTGFADFVITGYHLPGASAPDWLNPAKNCTGAATCINGYFTQGLVPTTGAFGGQNLGATMIELTG